MKEGLILQRDPQVKVMNKLLPKFTVGHIGMYNSGETLVSCKVKVKRVRKYNFDIPSWSWGSLYELDIVVSDIVYYDITGRTREVKSFVGDNKISFNRGLKSLVPYNVEKYVNMIDSNHYCITISKIEYNL